MMMQMVSRKIDETMMIIGDRLQITVKILSMSGTTVQIGIEAPRSVTIYREEVYKQIQVVRRKPVFLRKILLNLFRVKPY